MKYRYAFLFYLINLSGILTAQHTDLYMPVNIYMAYYKDTRSYSGNVGLKYWQNSSDYIINAKFEPKTNLLNGNEIIEYYNNSPDTLNQIVIKLYQDLFKKGNLRNVEIDPRDINDGTIIEKLLINDNKVEAINIKRDGTNMIISLNQPLSPKTHLKIEVEWNFTLPLHSKIKTGKIDSTTYFIGYWFPQIAVYDDISGWDISNYDGEHEFYNDFSNFDVSITVPSNYIIWATGTCQNYKNLLLSEYYNRYKLSLISDSIIHIIAEEDLDRQIVTSSEKGNTWHFKATYVTDFAFGTSNHYLWDASGVVIDKHNNKRVLINSAFKKDSKKFNTAASLTEITIKYLNEDFPGVAFPYPQMTIFNGFGGMEFPMITNMRSGNTNSEFVFTLTHEIAHNYFPFYVGTNQIKYAWMDEGMAMLLPAKLQLSIDSGIYTPRDPVNIISWYSGMEMTAPMMIPSIFISGYGAAVSDYYKSEIAFIFLRDMLGESIFNKALKEFIKRWNGKHPSPYDLFFTFENVSGKDLSWFWKAYFFEPGYPDLAITNVETKNGHTSLIIRKEGSLPVPVNIKYIYSDGIEENYYRAVEVWKTENDLKIEHIHKDKDLIKIILGNSDIPDTFPYNNIFSK